MGKNRLTTISSPALFVMTAILTFTPAPSAEAGRLQVVTTVSPITNIVSNVGGTNIEVQGVVPEGVNSHTFEPVPSDATMLGKADLIIMNGLHLELPTEELAEKVKKKSTKILKLGDNTISKGDWQFDFSFPESKGHPNPHLWPNISLAMRYAEITRDGLVRLDPAHKESYFANTTAYLAKMSKVDAATFDCVKSIPKNHRKLLTYHDSYAYFAPRYGMTIIGAIQPSDFSTPTPREVIRIIKQLKKESVPAIFGSEVFPNKVVKQIGREAGAVVIDELADDDLPGKKGDPNHTFLGMMVNNMRVMTKALGGDPGCVAGLDVTNVKN